LYQIIFSDGLVHGDLHPGNILVDSYENLTIIDFGLAWHLSREARVSFAEFFLGFSQRYSELIDPQVH
jgi:ubiquinone biosynthesis protein